MFETGIETQKTEKAFLESCDRPYGEFKSIVLGCVFLSTQLKQRILGLSLQSCNKESLLRQNLNIQGWNQELNVLIVHSVVVYRTSETAGKMERILGKVCVLQSFR